MVVDCATVPDRCRVAQSAAELFLWYRRQSVRWLYVWLPFLLTSTAAFHPRGIASRHRIDEAQRVQVRRPASRRTFCVSATVARLELIAGRSCPDAAWRHHTLRQKIAHHPYKWGHISTVLITATSNTAFNDLNPSIVSQTSSLSPLTDVSVAGSLNRLGELCTCKVRRT